MTETAIGPGVNADGRGPSSLRLDRQLALVTVNSHGSLYEQASRGNLFTCSGAVTGITVAAGHVAPPAAAAATTLTLSNPVGSGYNLEILLGILNHLTGTPGTGCWSWCTANAVGATVITATPNAVVRPCLAGGANSIASGYTATALTGGPLHVISRQMPSSVFAGAIGATSVNTVGIDIVDGGLVIPPGFIVTLAPPATGTTHVVAATILFAQVAIPS
jgi:hypothetical protein